MKREYNFDKGRRGPVVPLDLGKTRITIRLDNRVLDHFRKRVHEMGGGSYQTLINDALRGHSPTRRDRGGSAPSRAGKGFKGAGLNRSADG